MQLSFITICEYSSRNTLNIALKPFLSRLKSILFCNKDNFLTQNNRISFIVGNIYIACEYLHFSTHDLFLINQKKKKSGTVLAFLIVACRSFYIIWSSDYTLSKDEKKITSVSLGGLHAIFSSQHCGWPAHVKSSLCKIIVISK